MRETVSASTIVITEEEERTLNDFYEMYEKDRTLNHRRSDCDALELVIEGAKSFPPVSLSKE